MEQEQQLTEVDKEVDKEVNKIVQDKSFQQGGSQQGDPPKSQAEETEQLQSAISFTDAEKPSTVEKPSVEKLSVEKLSDDIVKDIVKTADVPQSPATPKAIQEVALSSPITRQHTESIEHLVQVVESSTDKLCSALDATKLTTQMEDFVKTNSHNIAQTLAFAAAGFGSISLYLSLKRDPVQTGLSFLFGGSLLGYYFLQNRE